MAFRFLTFAGHDLTLAATWRTASSGLLPEFTKGSEEWQVETTGIPAAEIIVNGHASNRLVRQSSVPPK
ncbi:hypothetical protein HAHE_22160 [Haloferula helveola]|uniref:Uncharacterized protein n=1 Tax=Haloferula helveola TaxID=490095 RepID=A0ABM7RCU6_9BACT|nr:hypothetical protein HAHE_22160 [Haloferula helveola]